MYTEPGFFEMVPGTIGTVSYKMSGGIKMSEKSKQEYVSKQASARLSAAIKAASIGGEFDPAQAYAKARQSSWDEIEEAWEIKEIHVQVGDKDSFDKITKLESQPGFVEWMNGPLVQALKDTYNTNKPKQDGTNK